LSRVLLDAYWMILAAILKQMQIAPLVFTFNLVLAVQIFIIYIRHDVGKFVLTEFLNMGIVWHKE
jgi:hypothetical protein